MNKAVPKEEITRRLDRLSKRLAEAGLDAAIFNQAVDIFYFSGSRQNSVLLVPLDGDPTLLVRKSYIRAKEESCIPDIRPFPPSKDLPSVFGERLKKIGITFDALPVQHFNFYRDLLKGRELQDISLINRELRAVKSCWELDQMKISGRMLASAFGDIPDYLRPGMRELDLAAEFEYRLRKSGIGGYLRIRGFNQEITGIAVAGENAALPGCFDGPITGKGHWTPAPYGSAEDVIKERVPLVVDYGASYNGYIVDMTRIFCFGGLDSKMKRAFETALEIQAWIAGNMKPGTTCEEIYSGAYTMADNAGLAENFMGHPGEQAKFVGHGVGLELDELPVLAPKFKYPLRTGNVIAVEPKFLFPGKGAVGIENTFALTELGCEKLTDLSDRIVYL